MPDEPKFNREQYDLLINCSNKENMTEWNEYVEKMPSNNINLAEADLSHAHLNGANLNRANLILSHLNSAHLKGTQLIQAKLMGADLSNSDLSLADLFMAELNSSNLNNAFLHRTRLMGATLCWADLRSAHIISATLNCANLRNAKITSAVIMDTSMEDWIIDGIECENIYFGIGWKNRVPKDRDFKPGEFEEIYKSLPTITYYFSDEFTPITPIIMDKVVQEINQKHPQFQLKLDSFHSRGIPNAVFTVLHKNHSDEALNEITNRYEKTIQRLEGKLEAYQDAFTKALDRPNMRIEHMGHTFENIQSGRDTNIATDDATLTVTNIENDIESLVSVLTKQNVPLEDLDKLKIAIKSDQNAPEHSEKSFGKNVKLWFSDMCLKAGTSAWKISEGAASGILIAAIKAYYGW